jgi:hypothetical protein
VVNLVVAVFVPRLVLTGLYDGGRDAERKCRERIRLLGCGPAYIESAIAFGRNAAQRIRAQVKPVN